MRSVLHIAVVAVLAAAIGGCQSTDSFSPDLTGSPSLSPSAQPSAIGTLEPQWTVTAFGDPGGVAFANDVVHAPLGFVAVGVQFSGHLPNVGPSPQHEGRIWLSADGTSWQDVTPSDTFTNVRLFGVFVRADGTLVALGGISATNASSGPENVDLIGLGAWESSDGRAWESAATGVPAGSTRVEQGERGYLALVFPYPDPGYELWHSADGHIWELVRELMHGDYTIGAGEEGFVVVGSPYQATLTPFAIASADGQEWFESASPPPDAVLLAPLGGDWIAIQYAFAQLSAPTWFSANGLDWAPHGDITMEQIPGSPFTEHPSSLSSAGGWLILGSTVSQEGGFVVHGTQWISGDGASWEALPFETETMGTSGSGAQVYAAAEGEGHLVLVGQMNNQAAFWSLALR